MSPDDIALDFMTEQEVAEIMATEDIFQVDMTNLDDLLEDVATDSDYEQQLDSPRQTASHRCNSYGGHECLRFRHLLTKGNHVYRNNRYDSNYNCADYQHHAGNHHRNQKR